MADEYILSTIHRAENTDDPKRLKAIFDALNEIAEETQIMLPLHPRTKALLPSAFLWLLFSDLSILISTLFKTQTFRSDTIYDICTLTVVFY